MRQLAWHGQGGQVEQNELTSFGANTIFAVAGYFNEDDQRHRAIVATSDGKVHEIFWKSSQVGIEGEGVLAEFDAGSIIGVAVFNVNSDPPQHIIVVTSDGEVHKLQKTLVVK